MQPTNLLAIFFGGGTGAVFRFLISTFIEHRNGARPIATLIVNISGCLLAGLLVGYFDLRPDKDQSLPLFLSVGLMGGYTTFSAFGIDTIRMIEANDMKLAILYVLGSVVLSLAATWCGHTSAKFFFH